MELVWKMILFVLCFFLLLFVLLFLSMFEQANDGYESMEVRRWDALGCSLFSFLFVFSCFALSISYPTLVAPVV